MRQIYGGVYEKVYGENCMNYGEVYLSSLKIVSFSQDFKQPVQNCKRVAAPRYR